VIPLVAALMGARTSSDSDWPPVLIGLVLFVLIGGAIVTFNFLRQARAATRRSRRK
jgi:hypothetical protein